jgi:hypothetical protein
LACYPNSDTWTKRKGAQDTNSSTQGIDRAAGTLRIGFINTEGVKNKFQCKDFLDLLKANEVFGIAESWAGSEKCEIRVYRDVKK